KPKHVAAKPKTKTPEPVAEATTTPVAPEPAAPTTFSPRLPLTRPLTTLPPWLAGARAFPAPLRPLPPLATGLPFALAANGPERVTRLEGCGAVARLVARLPAAPVDGILSADRFAALDADHDGAISRDEWDGPPPLFQRLDRNGDGFLIPAEI